METSENKIKVEPGQKKKATKQKETEVQSGEPCDKAR